MYVFCFKQQNMGSEGVLYRYRMHTLACTREFVPFSCQKLTSPKKALRFCRTTNKIFVTVQQV